MPPKKNTASKTSKPSSERATRVRTSSRPTVKETAKPIEKPKEKTVKKEKSVKEVVKPRKMAASARSTSTTATKKRKADEEDEKPREIKRSRVAKPRQPRAKPIKAVINEAPKTRLNVFVCGEGSSGELGLGTAKNVIDVKRPRLNKLLSAEEVGIVQVAVGGMHCVALTHDNKIFTWGVNDQGALGRDTNWDGGYKDIDDNSDSDSDDEDSGLNPLESNPTSIPDTAFPKGTVFVEVAAADSSSFALTDDGLVYGWGTFRVSEKEKSTRKNCVITL